MWESKYESLGEVHYGVEDNYGSEVTASVDMTNANTFINKATNNDLILGLKYNYFATQSETESKKLAFTTAPDNNNEDLTIIIWGDSFYPNPWYKMVDYMMNEIQPNLAFNTGDFQI